MVKTSCIFLKNSFLNEKGESWINIIPSVHQMCAHAWELFSMNDSSSISKWSESPVESWNKHVRSFQSGTSSRAQQVSVKENIHDIFVRMLISSHPSIASKSTDQPARFVRKLVTQRGLHATELRMQVCRRVMMKVSLNRFSYR